MYNLHNHERKLCLYPQHSRGGLQSIQDTDSLGKDGVRFFSENHKPLSGSHFFYSTSNRQVKEERAGVGGKGILYRGMLSHSYTDAHLPPITKAQK